MGSTGLLISEEFFLLSLTGGAGRNYTIFDEWTNGPVAAAMLDDLFLAWRLNFDAAGRVVADPTPTGDATLDVLLAIIAGADKPCSLRRWIGTFWHGGHGYAERVADRLAARGIMARTERRALRVIGVKRYALLDGAAREWVVSHLRAVVLGDGEPDIGTAMLLALLEACGNLRWIFTPDERRWAWERIEEIVAGDEVAWAIKMYLMIGISESKHVPNRP